VLDLVEVLLGADQRRSELYDGVAPVLQGPSETTSTTLAYFKEILER
jgi:hypothetical protein